MRACESRRSIVSLRRPPLRFRARVAAAAPCFALPSREADRCPRSFHRFVRDSLISEHQQAERNQNEAQNRGAFMGSDYTTRAGAQFTRAQIRASRVSAPTELPRLGRSVDPGPPDHQYMPPMPSAAAAAAFFSGCSDTNASVVSSSDAMDAEFSSADRTTFVGSMTPACTRFSNRSVQRVEAFLRSHLLDSGDDDRHLPARRCWRSSAAALRWRA